jgi:hypothetical protein
MKDYWKRQFGEGDYKYQETLMPIFNGFLNEHFDSNHCKFVEVWINTIREDEGFHITLKCKTCGKGESKSL